MADRKQLLEKQIEKPVEKESASSGVKASWEIGIRSDLLRDFEVTGFKQNAHPSPSDVVKRNSKS